MPTPSVASLGWAQLGLLFCPLLCSGGSDSCYREGYSLSASLHTHTMTLSPCLSRQPVLMLCDQQTRWRKRADTVIRLPLGFHATYVPQNGYFSPPNNWFTPAHLYFPFYTYKARCQKIGQTAHGCDSTENGCCGGRVHRHEKIAGARSRDGWRCDCTNTLPGTTAQYSILMTHINKPQHTATCYQKKTQNLTHFSFTYCIPSTT